MKQDLEAKKWWKFLEEDLQELFSESFILINFFETQIDDDKGRQRFHDYSFIVFPAAKAYEGFLKKLFLDLKFITEADYYGKHFRIGKALNPFLPKELEEESVYKKISDYANNREIASLLWETWKGGRNLVFHWFPNEKNAITFEEAQRRVEQIIDAIDEAYKLITPK